MYADKLQAKLVGLISSKEIRIIDVEANSVDGGRDKLEALVPDG